MARKRKESRRNVQPVTTEVGGQEVTGEYFVEGDIVYVNSPYGSKETQLGNSPAYSVASGLLHRLAASFANPGQLGSDTSRAGTTDGQD